MIFKKKFIAFITIFLCLGFTKIYACDTSPSIIVNQSTNNNDGTFTLDLSICIGTGGSEDGFDLYFENEIEYSDLQIKLKSLIDYDPNIVKPINNYVGVSIPKF